MNSANEKTVNLGNDSLASQAGCPEQYEIKGLVGHGGMGMVFRAFDLVLQRDVAIKLHFYEGVRQQEAQERFLREAKILSLLHQHNIVRIYSSGLNAHGNPYHVMEFLDGSPLSTELQRSPLNSRQFYEMCSQVLAGLIDAHHHKIFHRDLKPSNIMRCTDADGKPCYKLIDFGIARLEEDPEHAAKTITRTNSTIGSPEYMSPEQCRGQRGDQLSDIYSLGCIMYECVQGTPPFKADTPFEVMYKHMSDSPAPLPAGNGSAHGRRLAQLVMRCLEKDPPSRPQSAQEIADELKDIFDSGNTEIELFNIPKICLKPRKLKKYFAGGLLAATSLVLLVPAYRQVQVHNLQSRISDFVLPTEQSRISHEIAKAQERVEKWGAEENALKTPKMKIQYIKDLFALGHNQLCSLSPEDIQGAEKTFGSAFEFCKKAGIDPDKQAACLALKAKAECNENKTREACRDFETSLDLATDISEDNDLKIDILLERCFLWLSLRDFEKARQDLLSASVTYTKLTAADFKLDIMGRLQKINQRLDEKGMNRSDMVNNIAINLRKLQPNSEQDAEKMLRLSNLLVERMSQCKLRKGAEVAAQARYSVSLLDQVKNPELRAETRALMDAHKDWKNK